MSLAQGFISLRIEVHNMPNTTSTYEPLVLVDTADLPEEEWLEYRRRGIGGSDAAAILGVSPFATARDLYYDKLKVVSYEDGESNWVQKKVGHLLEDLVAEIFHVKTGFEIYQVKKMFYHPVYTYMLADIDYFIRLPNGKTAILEIKTTNYNAKDNWWLDGEETYNDTTLQRLAEQYYASTFRGTPGSEEMNQALRTWTDDNTGGLLKEYTENMAIAPETVFELVSTIYYKAMWRENFWEVNTEKETFHGAAGDTTVDMMKKTEWMDVYQGEHFRAVSLSLQDSGSMYFLLPDENTDVNELVSDADLMKVIRRDESSDNWYSPMVNLSVPKFKVSEKTDLIETVRALGVTDALDADLADFSPLTGDKENLYLSKADHAAMLEIDENGVTGAAYTELGVSETAAEIPDDEIDFVLDRPFLFLVTGQDGSILFSGVVRNIAET